MPFTIVFLQSALHSTKLYLHRTFQIQMQLKILIKANRQKTEEDTIKQNAALNALQSIFSNAIK